MATGYHPPIVSTLSMPCISKRAANPPTFPVCLPPNPLAYRLWQVKDKKSGKKRGAYLVPRSFKNTGIAEKRASEAAILRRNGSGECRELCRIVTHRLSVFTTQLPAINNDLLAVSIFQGPTWLSHDPRTTRATGPSVVTLPLPVPLKSFFLAEGVTSAV